jgi:hypothetical protein
MRLLLSRCEFHIANYFAVPVVLHIRSQVSLRHIILLTSYNTPDQLQVHWRAWMAY